MSLDSPAPSEDTVQVQSLSRSRSPLKLQNTNIQNIKRRIRKCEDRLQLRFPTVFRDGKLLQHLVPLILKNENISHLAIGLRSNYEIGFVAMEHIITERPFKLETLDIRLEDVADFISQPTDKLCSCFEAIAACDTLGHFIIRVNILTPAFAQLLTAALKHSHITELTLRCDMIVPEATKIICDDLIIFDENTSCNVQVLRLCIDQLGLEEIEIFARGIEQSHLRHLDLTDCQMHYSCMALLLIHLPKCQTLQKFSFGNNGNGTIRAFFQGLPQQRIKDLVCCESYSFTIEHISLDEICESLKKATQLEAVQIPMLIFDETSRDSIQRFCQVVGGLPKMHTMQFFPLFEHLDKIETSTELQEKLSFFLESLFQSLQHKQNLHNREAFMQRLYVEAIGCEKELFTKEVSEVFHGFIKSEHGQHLSQLQIGFCRLLELHPELLHSFQHCPSLVGATDDVLHHYHYDYPSNSENAAAEADEMFILYRKYQRHLEKVCQQNIAKVVCPFIDGVECLASLIADFVGFVATPEKW